MADNMRVWDALYKTDPKHTKPFTRAGGFKGTATKPIWLTKRLTEHFGPAGIGWGMDEPKFQTVSAGEEILVFCTVALWYYPDSGNELDGKQRGTVYGVGGDKVLTKRQSGPFTNDEAFKASYTDALSNAMKQIGVGADIHMGLFEDEKYVREMAREFASMPKDVHGHPHLAAAAEASAGPRQSSAHGRELAASEPHLVANAGGRLKGTTAAPAKAKEPTKAELRAAKITKSVDDLIAILKGKTWTKFELADLWHDYANWREWMEDPKNDADAEYQRFYSVYATVEADARDV